ncbi:hypothetical protein [Nocardia xishanensis]|uniref:hypothetical protein n=1 Tax=Nocardia xishanensis TaxID=238964 RepID=UPI000834D2BA|nr:hypothetical protein [Nocardia xishanensis]
MPASTLADPLCEDCSHPITAATVVSTVEGEKLCSDCAAEVSRCDECAAHTRDPRVTVDDTYLCSQCLIDWQRCTDCDRYTREATAIVGGGDACEQCLDNYDSCADCGNRASDTYAVDSRGRVCDNCQEDYRECADCYILIPREDTYCESCGDNHTPTHSQVHDWSYKPTPQFHGNGPLFLGFELEIKIPRGVFTEAVDTTIDHVGQLAYLKEDSSIRPCGFELVTHPMSYEYALTEFPWRLLKKLRLLGAYTDEHVGIHVHLSRAGFDSSAHIYRWLKFVYRNETAVTTLARRSSPEWAMFSDEARSRLWDYAHGTEDFAWRYEAVNVRPEHTFELRVFASSLHPQQVQAALAFAAASVDYTRHLSAAQIARRRGWEWTAFTTWVRSRPDYSPLLAEMEALACAS